MEGIQRRYKNGRYKKVKPVLTNANFYNKPLEMSVLVPEDTVNLYGSDDNNNLIKKTVDVSCQTDFTQEFFNSNRLGTCAVEGRRIIDVSFLAEMLKRGCIMCKTALHLSNCFQERKYGLANVALTGYSEESIEEIPPPPSPLVSTPVETKEYTRIYFDLETTGLGLADITQISAVCGAQEFSMYVIPESPIQPSASKITGLVYDGTMMFKRGSPVSCCSLQHALQQFKQWIEKFKNPLLLAHNAKKFDSLVLSKALKKVPNIQLEESICGFCDTLDVFKAILPHQASYSQETLVKNILNIQYDAHDALTDCKMLQRLVELPEHKIEDNYLMHSFTINFALQVTSKMLQSSKNLETLKPLKEGRFISDATAKKISSSGLSLHHLKLAFDRNGQSGISSVLSEVTDGHIRVTGYK